MTEAAAAWRGLPGVRALADRIEEWARGRQGIRALAFFGSLQTADKNIRSWVEARLTENGLAA